MELKNNERVAQQLTSVKAQLIEAAKEQRQLDLARRRANRAAKKAALAAITAAESEPRDIDTLDEAAKKRIAVRFAYTQAKEALHKAINEKNQIIIDMEDNDTIISVAKSAMEASDAELDRLCEMEGKEIPISIAIIAEEAKKIILEKAGVVSAAQIKVKADEKTKEIAFRDVENARRKVNNISLSDLDGRAAANQVLAKAKEAFTAAEIQLDKSKEELDILQDEVYQYKLQVEAAESIITPDKLEAMIEAESQVNLDAHNKYEAAVNKSQDLMAKNELIIDELKKAQQQYILAEEEFNKVIGKHIKITKALEKQAEAKKEAAKKANNAYFVKQFDIALMNPSDFIPSYQNCTDTDIFTREEVEDIIYQVSYRFHFPDGYKTIEECQKYDKDATRGRFTTSRKWDRRPMILIPSKLFWLRVIPWYKAQKAADEAILRVLNEEDKNNYKEIKTFLKEFKKNNDSKIQDLLNDISFKNMMNQDISGLNRQLEELKKADAKDTPQYRKYIELRNKASEYEAVKEANQHYMDMCWRGANTFKLAGPHTYEGGLNSTPEASKEVMRFLMTNEVVGILDINERREAALANRTRIIEEAVEIMATEKDRDEWYDKSRSKEAEEKREEAATQSQVSKELEMMQKVLALDFKKVGAIEKYSDFVEEYNAKTALDMYKDILINNDGLYNVEGADYGISMKKGLTKIVELKDSGIDISKQYILSLFENMEPNDARKIMNGVNATRKTYKAGKLTDFKAYKCLGYFAPYSSFTKDGVTFANPFNFFLYQMKKDIIESLASEIKQDIKEAIATTFINVKSWSNLIYNCTAEIRKSLFFDFTNYKAIPKNLKEEVLAIRKNSNGFVGQLISTKDITFETDDEDWNELLTTTRSEIFAKIKEDYEKETDKAYQKLSAGTYGDFPIPVSMLKKYGTIEEAENAEADEVITLAAQKKAAFHIYQCLLKVAETLVWSAYCSPEELGSIYTDAAKEEC